MPVIDLKMYEGRTTEQKREFAAKVTELAVDVLKAPPEAVTVTIQEFKRENWAVAGKLSCDPEE